MTDKQPDALRLADAIDPLTRKSIDNLTCACAATELRRLHAENEALRAGEAFHKVAVQQRNTAWMENEALHEANEAFGKRQEWWNERMFELEKQRNELLEALKEIDSWLVCSCIATAEDMAQSFPHMQQVASAAIARAEGKQ